MQIYEEIMLQKEYVHKNAHYIPGYVEPSKFFNISNVCEYSLKNGKAAVFWLCKYPNLKYSFFHYDNSSKYMFNFLKRIFYNRVFFNPSVFKCNVHVINTHITREASLNFLQNMNTYRDRENPKLTIVTRCKKCDNNLVLNTYNNFKCQKTTCCSWCWKID